VLHDGVRLGPLSDVVGDVAAELAEIAARWHGLLVPLFIRHAVVASLQTTLMPAYFVRRGPARAHRVDVRDLVKRFSG
jgi:hypothetical protein